MYIKYYLHLCIVREGQHINHKTKKLSIMETLKITNVPTSLPAGGFSYSADILPIGKVLRQNSTHVAILDGSHIVVFIKGLEIYTDATQTDTELSWQPERLYALPIEEQDDLDAIFERYDEDNRCNLAEANGDY